MPKASLWGRDPFGVDKITRVSFHFTKPDSTPSPCQGHPFPKGMPLAWGRDALGIGGDSLGRGRAGIEPVIGHLKHDHRMVRNFLIRRILNSYIPHPTSYIFNTFSQSRRWFKPRLLTILHPYLTGLR